MIIIQKHYSNPYTSAAPSVFAEDLKPGTDGNGPRQWVRVEFGKSETPVPLYNLPEGSHGYFGDSSLEGTSSVNPGANDPKSSSLNPGLVGAGILAAGYALHRARKKRKGERNR
jgi:hypothetical protein